MPILRRHEERRPLKRLVLVDRCASTDKSYQAFDVTVVGSMCDCLDRHVEGGVRAPLRAETLWKVCKSFDGADRPNEKLL